MKDLKDRITKCIQRQDQVTERLKDMVQKEDLEYWNELLENSDCDPRIKALSMINQRLEEE
jgi:hypothetical protein